MTQDDPRHGDETDAVNWRQRLGGLARAQDLPRVRVDGKRQEQPSAQTWGTASTGFIYITFSQYAGKVFKIDFSYRNILIVK